MGCHELYLACFNAGITEVCECSKDKSEVVNNLYTLLISIYNKYQRNITRLYRRYPDQLCMYRKVIIDEIGCIVKCFEECYYNANNIDYLRKHCPTFIACDEDYIKKLYTLNGHEIKHPDILIIKGRLVTIIVEEKSYARQGFKKFRQKLIQSYEYLPANLRSSCVFIVYAPKRGGTLPVGFKRHPELSLLMYDRRIVGESLPLFEIPVIVLEPTLLLLLYRRRS